MSRYADLLVRIHREVPAFSVVRKSDSWHQRAIHWALYVLSFGMQRRYMTSFVTTIGSTVYVPDGWDAASDDSRYVTMAHERMHLLQFRRYTLPLMALLYLLLPLPVGLAWFRMRFEWEGYAETVRATAEVYGRGIVETKVMRNFVVSQFVGPNYLWPWPYRRAMERRYDAVVATIPPAQPT